VVGVEERESKPPGELAAVCGFTRAGEADEGGQQFTISQTMIYTVKDY
jgi:hypothetical protein